MPSAAVPIRNLPANPPPRGRSARGNGPQWRGHSLAASVAALLLAKMRCGLDEARGLRQAGCGQPDGLTAWAGYAPPVRAQRCLGDVVGRSAAGTVDQHVRLKRLKNGGTSHFPPDDAIVGWYG